VSGAEIAIIVAAVLVGSLVKSITGMGLPLVAIPVLTLFVDAETAITVLAIPNAAQNVTLSVRHRDERHEIAGLTGFCVAGIGGAALGAIALGLLPEWVVQLALIAIVVAYLVTALSRPDLRIADATVRRFAAPVGFVAGIFQGGVGISGPIVATWHHAQRLGREAFVFAVATVFFISGTTQVVVFAAQGAFADRIGVSLALTAIVMATIPAGAWLRAHTSVATFQRLVLGLLAVSCVSLVVDVGRTLW
jgi:uncharacterized membrane protein YfcA